jgi:hypothetical protein
MMDLTQKYKQNIYHIELNVSGWDTVTLQVVAPVVGVTSIYGTINDGMSQGSLYPSNNYGASRARDWSAIQAVDLATGTATGTISAAGLYAIPVNTPNIRLAGGGNIYGLFQFNSKIG